MDFDIDTLRTVTQFAGLAPSVHNTQPWRFVAAGGHTLEVRADTARMLSYLDPTSRQLHISCGLAIEFARLAVRSLGHDAVVRLRPGDDPTLLATITIGRPLQTTATEQRWVEAAPRRYTDRGAYDETPVPGDVLAAAQGAAADRGCWMRVLDRLGERTTVAMLLDEAEQLEATDPRYREEIAAWGRSDAPAPDGVPHTATTWTPPTAPAGRPGTARRACNWRAYCRAWFPCRARTRRRAPTDGT